MDGRPDPLAEESRALARAVAYAFLSAAYRYPDDPAAAGLRRLADAVPESLALLSDFGEDAGRRFAELVRMAGSLESREAEHTRVFGHAPEGKCPPYEGLYGDTEEGLQMPHELSDLMAFYRAFGLELSPRARERVDFVAVESEFLAFLCRKQAYAEEVQDAALAAISVDAQRKFLRDHLGRWVPAFARRVIQQAGGGFFRDLAHFTLAFVLDECRRLGVQPGADHLRMRVAVPERDACFDCPHAVGSAEPAAGAAFPV